MARINNYRPYGAFMCNGVWFEDEVPGYHTLNTQNRYLIEKNLIVRESDLSNGGVVTNSKYPIREIEVEYMIEANSIDDFQTSYLLLMELLDTENAQIIFNGEPDKYVTGYFVAPSDVDETQATRTGTYKIVCADPFKYSIVEYSESATQNQWQFTYDGTYKSHPTFEVTFPLTEDADGDNTDTSECGYVGFANQAGAVLQFGDPNETDWADVTYPAKVALNRTFKTKTGWTQNGSAVISGTQVGTVTANSNGYIYPSAWGSGTGWHGPSLSYIITGETEPISKNFNFTWKQKFVGNKKQFGRCTIILWNNVSGTRKMVGAVQVLKTTKDTKCKVYLYCGSTSSVSNYTVDCNKIASCSMKKLGAKITYNVGGKAKTYSNSAISDLIANEVTFHFARNNSQTVLANNYIYNCKLQRFAVTRYEDVQNLFSPGDTLIVDTRNADVTLDSGDGEINAQGIGALGNDWETFVLTPGTNLIEVDYSEWVTTTPTAVLKYRKVYL